MMNEAEIFACEIEMVDFEKYLKFDHKLWVP